LSASWASSGARIISITMLKVPATKEPTAEIVRAGPARPARAIW
jgi:hypothetical protein